MMLERNYYYVVDYFTGNLIQSASNTPPTFRFILDVVDGISIYDYTSDCDKLLLLMSSDGSEEYYYKERFKDKIIYDRRCGRYIIEDNLSEPQKLECKYNSGIGYIYDFQKVYEASQHLKLFKDKQMLISPEEEFKLSKFFKYTFGLEFETAMGIIPEEICFRDGLIPLRDGSIAGNEYSTVVLSGNKGLNLLKQQVNTLKDYTYFDKNCSLHVHLGGFDLNPEFIYNVYLNCVHLQDNLSMILPSYSFNTSQYKNTRKDYCKKLPTNLYTFESFYKYFVGRPFFGDLNQPHPNDLTRDHKWNIDKRYYFVNFINALCYKGGKTIEFRFLRPTYNLNKIIFWLYIFNAILICSEHGVINDFHDLVYGAYPMEIANELLNNITKCRICSEIQARMGDYIGERTDIEDRIFNTIELI